MTHRGYKANREEGAAAPNQRQGQDQPQHQDAGTQTPTFKLVKF